MPEHKRTHLTFQRTEENPFGIHFFHIHLASWATEEQLDFASKVAAIASAEGWVLKIRKEKKVSDIIAGCCHSLVFSVDLWKKESSTSSFLPPPSSLPPLSVSACLPVFQQQRQQQRQQRCLI